MFKEILVIDDNPDIRFLICNILEEQNFKVRSAANYDQAVLEINNRLPDLAIIDIKLDKPEKDGIDLLKLVNKKNKLTPVIMISGHATVQVAVEAIRLGANAVAAGSIFYWIGESILSVKNFMNKSGIKVRLI